MSRIGIILALPVEYNNSSMIRCKSIIGALGAMGNDIVCYCPKPDANHRYYSSENVELPRTEIVRYKRQIVSVIKKDDSGKKANPKSALKNFLLKCYRKIDLFGSSIRYVPERKWVSEDIRNRKIEVLLSFSDPKPAHIIGGYCKKHYKSIAYIQQWGDPLAADITNKSILPKFLKKCVEKKMIGPADKVYYVSPITLNTQKIRILDLNN